MVPSIGRKRPSKFLILIESNVNTCSTIGNLFLPPDKPGGGCCGGLFNGSPFIKSSSFLCTMPFYHNLVKVVSCYGIIPEFDDF